MRKYSTKRRADAATRRFFDEFPRVSVCPFRARGVVDPSRSWAKIPFPDGTIKLLWVEHRAMRNGGGYSFWKCPRCAHLSKLMYLVDDKPLCGHCCRKMNIVHRTRYGWGVAQRIEARQKALDALIAKLESGERLRVKPTPAAWYGKKALMDNSIRLTQRMRRNLVALRLKRLADGKLGPRGPRIKPQPIKPLAQPFNLPEVWKAKTVEQLDKALDKAQLIITNALNDKNPNKQIAAAKTLTNHKI